MNAIWRKLGISWSRHRNKIKNTYSYKESWKKFPTSECIDPEFFQSENVNPTILRFHAIKLFLTQIEKDCSCSFKQGRLTFTAFSFIRPIPSHPVVLLFQFYQYLLSLSSHCLPRTLSSLIICSRGKIIAAIILFSNIRF